MDSVRLQCHICCSVGEIKNTFLQPVDVVTIVPIVELHSCKHQICATCVRKIRQRRRHVECPMCRHDNTHITVYSVNRNVVETMRCGVSEVREFDRLGGMLDAASLARSLFEKTLIDAESVDEFTPGDLRSVLTRLQSQISERAKANHDLQLQAGVLTRANEIVERRIDKGRGELTEVRKQLEELRRAKASEERALKLLANKRVRWTDKNAKLERDNRDLENENIRLIRDNYLFKNAARETFM
ncbi:CG30 [Samia ricini nucleopolyhedrovirus]|nr:CG30 [Samia ricini nucleopolyhedrovirus]BBD51284.1 CG30 [Samia ricini nucleopolyhedrovirus]BBD51436.1 CG30 [Samia ricini nucleopolyhedrovirus]